MKIRNHRKVRLCRVDFSNCFVRWTGNGARKRGTIDGRFARIYSGRFIPENRAAGRLLCERHLHRFRAHECGIEGGGTQQYEKVFPRNGGIQGGGGTREEECSFPEGEIVAQFGELL